MTNEKKGTYFTNPSEQSPCSEPTGSLGPSADDEQLRSCGVTAFMGPMKEYTLAELAEFAERYYGDDCEDWND